MDLSLTPQQELLKSSAREFVRQECPKERLLELDKAGAGYSAELWEKLASIGWLGMLIPERYGGAGGSLTDASVVFEELGRGPVPGPHFSSAVLGALSVLEAGTEEQKRRILPQVVTGQMRLALAITEPDYGWSAEQVRMAPAVRNGAYVLNGTKLFVHDALAGTHLLCAVRTEDGRQSSGGVSLLVVDTRTPGVSVRNVQGFISGVAEVTFDSVQTPASSRLGDRPGAAWPALERAMQRAIPVLCAYQVGGCQAVFDTTVEYSRTRVQFGQPIGRFQRVQDHIINIVNHLDAARWTTYEALWKLDSGRPAATSVHMAKAVTSEAYHRACTAAHEVHAGIGVVREYGLTLHTRMSRTLYHLLGDPAYHKKRLGNALGL